MPFQDNPFVLSIDPNSVNVKPILRKKAFVNFIAFDFLVKFV